MEEEGSELSMDCQLDASCKKGNIQATAAFFENPFMPGAARRKSALAGFVIFFNLTLTIPAGLPVLSAKEVSDEGGSLRTW